MYSMGGNISWLPRLIPCSHSLCRILRCAPELVLPVEERLMMTWRRKQLWLFLTLLPAGLVAQLLDPPAFKKPLTDTWPTYNGDYTGQRQRPLSKINASNVNTLVLAWTHRFDLGPQSKSQQSVEGRRIKATPLLVKGVLYFSITDHIWAADARTGRELWHYEWPDNR